MAYPGDTQTLNIGVYTPDNDGKLSSKASERGEACDADDSVSVPVTECSVEEEEEEVIEESQGKTPCSRRLSPSLTAPLREVSMPYLYMWKI